MRSYRSRPLPVAVQASAWDRQHVAGHARHEAVMSVMADAYDVRKITELEARLHAVAGLHTFKVDRLSVRTAGQDQQKGRTVHESHALSLSMTASSQACDTTDGMRAWRPAAISRV
jgi:hypothetical protein